MIKQKIQIPLSVPGNKKNEYRRNYQTLTNNFGRLFLLAGDQKVEHLNDDFFGSDITPEDNDPEHLFKIAATARGGVLATHLGLVARYGHNYRTIPYIIKLNGKTNLNPGVIIDSSKLWWSINDVVKFKKDSGLKIVGIGYTLYLGGQYEAEMLATAGETVYQAHQAGLTAVLWVYPRGSKINEENIHTIAGGAGVAAALNADFVKVKYPFKAKDKLATAKKFQEVIQAAGRTKVICVGGSYYSVKALLENLAKQIKISGTSGLAIGRNLHQRSLEEASRLATALSAIIFHNQSAAEAYNIYSKSLKPLPRTNGKFLGLF